MYVYFYSMFFYYYLTLYKIMYVNITSCIYFKPIKNYIVTNA